MELSLLDDQGQPTAKVPASDAAFGRAYNEALVHQVVTAYRNAGRAGTTQQHGQQLVVAKRVGPESSEGPSRPG